MDVLRVARAEGKMVALMQGEKEGTGADLFQQALTMPPGIVDVLMEVVSVQSTDDGAVGFTAAGCDRFLGKGVRICAACSTKRIIESKCSGCKLAYYCSETCQRNHWSSHRSYCKEIAVVHERSMVANGMDASQSLRLIVEHLRAGR